MPFTQIFPPVITQHGEQFAWALGQVRCNCTPHETTWGLCQPKQSNNYYSPLTAAAAGEEQGGGVSQARRDGIQWFNPAEAVHQVC